MPKPDVSHAGLGLAGASAAVVSSALAVGLVLSPAPAWAAFIPGLLSWIWLAIGALVLVARPRDFPELALGPMASARMLLLVAVATSVLVDGDQSWVVWTAVAAIATCTAAEPVLVRLRPRQLVANLPGAPAKHGNRLALGTTLAGMAVLAGFWLLSVVDAEVVWWWLVTAVQLVLTCALATVGLLSRLHHGRDADTTSAALAAHAPLFAIYSARRDGGGYQLRMWLPYLEALGMPFVVITRHDEAVRVLAHEVAAPVICCESWADLDRVVVPSLRTVFYVNSLGANSDFVTYRQMRHVYLGHGESDKALSAHPAHAMYDRIVVAGQGAIDRYARSDVRILPAKFVIAGRPQAAEVGPTRPTAADGSATVLYAPTWGGYNTESSYSSLPRGEQLVRALLARGCTVAFRPHPFSRQRPHERALVERVEALLRADGQATGRRHLSGESTSDLNFAAAANASDAMLCDLSSVIADWLASGKPMAAWSVDPDLGRFAQEHPMARCAYLIAPGLDNLESVLDDLLGADPLAASRAALREYYLGPHQDDPVAHFVTVIRDFILAPRAIEGVAHDA